MTANVLEVLLGVLGQVAAGIVHLLENALDAVVDAPNHIERVGLAAWRMGRSSVIPEAGSSTRRSTCRRSETRFWQRTSATRSHSGTRASSRCHPRAGSPSSPAWMRASIR